MFVKSITLIVSTVTRLKNDQYLCNTLLRIIEFDSEHVVSELKNCSVLFLIHNSFFSVHKNCYVPSISSFE